MSKHPYRISPEPTSKLPGGIPYIIGNEAAERFSFYGMKGILVVFMHQYLHWMTANVGEQMSKAEATEHYHSFTSWVYLTPIFGALLSDAILGKYRTILSLSTVYCLGHLALAFMGMEYGGISPAYWLFMGLTLIAIGAGGIKPCVSAHVGDQFGESNKHWLSKVFGWFYIAINVGAAISNIMTPWLLEHYGPHWAFGLPGVLMALATFVFWLGRHKFIHVPPGGIGFIKEAFSNEGIICVLKVCSIFVFIIIFWALFDQTGSTWVLQAEDMDRTWLGITWLSAQFQVLNPVLIVIMVPLFTMVLYPLADKYLFKMTPLRRISIGLFIMIAGFAIPSWIQMRIDAGEVPSIGWQVIAYGLLTASEVMVSITALEFAYTQAPPKMKSIIMALFFASVALGNYFTSGVNRYIQVPSQVTIARRFTEDAVDLKNGKIKPQAEIDKLIARRKDYYKNSFRVEQSDQTIILSSDGYDGNANTDDDFQYEATVKVPENPSKDKDRQFELGDVKLKTSVDQLLEDANLKIDEFFQANDQTLPLTEPGSVIVSEFKDPWGEPLRYRLVNRNIYRITSTGGDKEYMTPADIVLTGEVVRAEAGAGARPLDEYPLTWLEKRRLEVNGDREMEKIMKERGQSASTTISSEVTIGGQTKLEGAPYFWFWTKLMAATAIAFVFVSMLYKPREYLQEEADVEDNQISTPGREEH